ncbi:DUF916 and DUF3324 domain-containing protein [Carnobacterium maltaromaticum]|uniref:DUF916 and DUF3324 domain-containing protein n=1 Tax=Carnobacterium maltaromaticum TaxID=2751 RepID=UPI00295E787E|nr:DUF916 and DUF3324 domain-containing protein [Carnobacterium maltaromaticum]
MKKISFFWTVILLLSNLFVISYPQSVLANGAEFSVVAILPENQKTKNISYFDFELLPNNEQTIEVEITNGNIKREKTYVVDLNTATTNMNGIIDYTEQNKEKDESLQISIAEIATFDKDITIPAGGTSRVPITLKMPDEKFDGILLGGITVMEVDENDSKEQNQIKNRFSYSIGVVLSQGDINPSIELNFLGVDMSQINRRSVISGNIQNSAATVINDLSLDAKIYRKGSRKPMFKRSEVGLRMAPNSNFDFGVETNDQPLKAGTYQMDILASVGENEWFWTKEFEVSTKKAKELNETAIGLEKNSTIKYLYIAIGLLGTIFIIVILLVFYTKPKE